MKRLLILLLVSFLLPVAALAEKKDFYHEQKELMQLLKEEQFLSINARIEKAVKNKEITNDGFYFLDALLSAWFNTPKKVPIEIDAKLDKWIKAEPKNYLPHLIKGALYVDYGWNARGEKFAEEVKDKGWRLFNERLQIAGKELVTVNELNPDILSVFPQTMRVYLAYSEDEAMEESFKIAIKADPKYFAVYSKMFKALSPRWGGSEKALFDFANKYSKDAPKNTLLPMLIVMAHEDITTYPDFGKGRKHLAQPEVWEEIDGAVQKVFRDFPKAAYWRAYYAELAGWGGREEVAKKYFQLAEEANPNEIEVYRKRADFYCRIKQCELSIKDYKKAVELDPTDHRSYYWLSNSYQKSKDYDSALDAMTKAIEVAPEDEDYYAERCTIYSKQNKWEEALKDCSKALELDPKDQKAIKMRGYLLIKAGKKDEAEKEYGKSLLLNETGGGKTDGYEYYNIGVISRDKKDYEKARMWFEKAAATDYPEAYGNLGNLYLQGNGVAVDFKKAAEYFRKGAELGDAPSQMNYGTMIMRRVVDGTPVEAFMWFSLSAEQGYGSVKSSYEKLKSMLSPEEVAEAEKKKEEWKKGKK